jgi:hypothetical protein
LPLSPFLPLLSLLPQSLACSRSAPAPEDEPAIADVAGLRPERTYYVKTEEGARFGGFDGALERTVAVGDRTITPDEHGRFSVDLPAEATIELDVGLQYRLRDPDLARAEAVRPAISGAGSVPNDLLIAGFAGDAYGVLVRSGDRGVSIVDLASGLSDEGARIDGHPFFAGIIDAEARRVAVSDYDGGEIHLLDLAAGIVERTLPAPAVELDAAFPLSRPFDLDGDGAAESEVVRFVARSPQSVVRAGDRLLAGYSGFVDGRSPPVFVPGVIASWSLVELDAPPRVLVLDALDPQELRVLDDGRALAVCSGALETSGGVGATTEGAIAFFDPSSLELLDQIRLGDFAPGSALIAAGRIVVASLASPRVRIIGDDGQSRELVVNDETIDSIFRLVELGGGLVGVPSFNTDRLHILDARTGELDPAPFFAPLRVGPGRPVFDGLQIVAARAGRRGIDFTGPDLFALTGQASEVVPIELRKVLGP